LKRAILTNNSPAYIDHLIPLSLFLNTPLLTYSTSFLEAKEFYPTFDLRYVKEPYQLTTLMQDFDTYYSCLSKSIFEKYFFLQSVLLNKKLKNIWVPHGNSDKGLINYCIKTYQDNSYALIYGKRLINCFKELGFSFDNHLFCGNFRYFIYKKYKKFFDNLFYEKILQFLPKNNKNILYAPTWNDKENFSFPSAINKLARNLPDHFNLLIKPHPNHIKEDYYELDLFVEKFKDKKNLIFIRDFPPVYPILNATDLFIGDISSVCYDFLTFNKPMFFLNQNIRKLYLYKTGMEIFEKNYNNIFQIIENFLEKEDKFSKIRQETYDHTFEDIKCFDKLKKEILTFGI